MNPSEEIPNQETAMPCRRSPRTRPLLTLVLALLVAACGPEGSPADGADRQGAEASETTDAAERTGDERPQADPADVDSPEALEAALYDVISGPADEERDWDRFRSLFLPEANLTVTRRVSPEGEEEDVIRTFTVDEFAESAGQMMSQDGFWESSLSSTAERYGNVAHVFSTYESRAGSPDSEPFARGINSIQLVNDGERWWVANLVWDSETATNPIPEEYLPEP